MSIVFDKAPKETHEIIASMAGKHHPDLVDAMAKLDDVANDVIVNVVKSRGAVA